jgi:acylphosphatase
VQGVWFRDWTRREALSLGLSGWARNRSDGSVEALFEGDGEAVGEMIGRCRSGPRLARVDEIELLEDGEPETEPSGSFDIRASL